MKKHDKDYMMVHGTEGSAFGTQEIEHKPIASLDRTATAFVRELATCTGMSESDVLDLIIVTYRRTHGFNPPF